MDLNQIGNLFERIMVHYPRFASQVTDGSGNMRLEVAKEWERMIGFLDFDEALKRLDAYMDSEDGKRTPMARDFKQFKSQPRQEVFHTESRHQWKVVNGQLMDEEDRVYADPSCPDEPYYYDNMGRICQRGRVVYGQEEARKNRRASDG